MWYKSATFPTQDIARKTWKSLHDMLLPLSVDLTTLSIIFAGKWHVVAISESTPNSRAQGFVERFLSKGTPATLPEGVLNQLLERRLNRTAQASRHPTAPSLVYEGHTPTPISYDSPTPQKPEEIEAHLRTVVESLHQQGYPFIATYSLYAGYRLGYSTGIVGNTNPLKEVIKQSLINADRYLFTDSARVMHKTVFSSDSTFIPVQSSLWIEQDIPQPFTALGIELKAVHMFMTSKDKQWCINVIKDTTEHAMSMTYDLEDGIYTPTIDYTCPYGLCEDFEYPYESMGPNNYMVYRKPCKQCDLNAIMWASWLHTAIEMIQKKYAISSDPQPFTQRTLSYSEKRLVQRHHGKGKPKEKQFTVDYAYTVVAYDVSEVKQTHKPETQSDETPKHDSWLTLHGMEDRIYERRHFPQLERHYKGSHFERLKKRCLTEGTITEDRKEYSIEIDAITGETIIVGKVAGYQKYVPLLRSDLRKTSVIKKVTAKRYQEN